MIADRCMMDAMFSWNHMLSGRTGRFRYTEESFDVNELLAALGVPTPATDPYTNQPVKILNAFTSSTVSERYMEDHEWSSWDKQSWKDLLKRPEILLSDHDRFTGGVFVANISNLPPFMTQQMLNQQQVTIHGGHQTRDFIYVSNIVESIIASLSLLKKRRIFENINVLTGVSTSINELFKILAQHIDYNISPKYTDLLLGDPIESGGTIAKLQSTLMLDPNVFKTLNEGLLRTIKSIDKN